MASSVMRKVSMRSLSAHKLRLLLTVFSVVLGTSFVAAAVIFTATVQNSFNAIFDNVARGVATQVTASDPQAPGVPVTVVDELKADAATLGIDKLLVDYSGAVTIAQADGSALQTGGAPSIGSAFIPPDQAIDTGGLKLASGRAPSAPNEIAINTDAAEKAGLKLGSKTRVVLGAGMTPPMDVTVVGLLDMPTATGGFVSVQFSQEEAKKLFSDGKFVGSIDLSAKPGVSDTDLRDRVAALINPPADQIEKGEKPPYNVRTGAQVREDQKESIGTLLDIFKYVLLAFAAIGLIVGTFIIYNTFSMIVAQRNRELALLRAIGASRKNVSRSVLLEALVVGIIGGVIGLGLGVGIAAAMQALTTSSGVPSGGLQVGVWAILSAIFVGIVVTLISAWFPAQRASRIPPVEAMRMSAAEPGAGSLRIRTLVGLIFGGIGVLLLILGVFLTGGWAMLAIAPAAVLIIVAVILGAPALSQPVVGAIGRVLQVPFGTVGKLARTNAVRNPRRTAATAFALTIGLILVVIIGSIGASFKGTIDAGVDKSVTADYIVSSNSGGPMSASVGEAVAKAPDAKTVVSFDVVMAKLGRVDNVVTAAVGGAIDDVLVVDMVTGPSQVPADGMLVSQRAADTRGWKVGEAVTFTSTTGVDVPVTVAGIYATNEALGDFIVGTGAFDKLAPSANSRMTFMVLVKGKPGVSSAALRTQLEDAVKPYLTAQVQDRQQFKNAFASMINQMMATLYALLGLALVIAVLGIINTLALSVVERKQEIGMLRAIGMSRPQLRRTIYLESAYIAIFGALLGVIVGLAIGLPLVHAMRHWGLETLVVPWSLIGITLAGSAIVGVIAALWPAVTASRTKPLEAITE